jgi:3-hydroxyisobutyrate dehydrogenase
MTTVKRIGFIGIGNMGSAMAAHLVKAEFEVAVYDIRPETVEIFVAQHGGRAASTLEDVARGAHAIVTMLPDHHIVAKAVLGDGAPGAAAALARGSIVIDMSTSDPEATRTLAGALQAQGLECLDAPVMGGVVFARDATLDIMVGGDAAVLERCRPLFAALGRTVLHCGPIGAGHALKALANYVNACALINVVEAVVAGKRFGLDPEFMTKALIPLCAGRNHPAEKKVLPHVLTRKYGTGMALGFIAKDVRIALDTARAHGGFAPLAERVSELWTAAAEKLGPGVDQTEIARYWEEAAGVSIGKTPPK